MQVFGYSHLKIEMGWTSRPGEGGFSPSSPPLHCLHPCRPPYRHWKHKSCNSNLLSSSPYDCFPALTVTGSFLVYQDGIWSLDWRQRSMCHHAHKLCFSLFVYLLSLYSADVLRENRYVGNPVIADQSNFLHPVVYYWKNPPKPGNIVRLHGGYTVHCESVLGMH